jgi:hypothetical protein
MSRRCQVCNLEEHRLQIDSRIRAGESLAVLAKEFKISVDSLSRHRARHVLRAPKPVSGDLTARLDSLILRLEETYNSAASRGDHRMMLDSLKQIGTLTAQLVEIEKKDISLVENMKPKFQTPAR